MSMWSTIPTTCFARRLIHDIKHGRTYKKRATAPFGHKITATRPRRSNTTLGASRG
jgi:hypothetical protein